MNTQATSRSWRDMLASGQSMSDVVYELKKLDGHKMNISVLTQITIPDHPEDETFRKLTQKPFDVVADAVAANNLRDYKGVDSDFIIKCYGWTVEEYAREWNRRNPD